MTDAWDLDVATAMHRDGATLAEIAHVCLVSKETARTRLKEAGVYGGASNPRGFAFDTNRGRAIIAMREAMGMTFAAIGDLYGYSRQWAHQSYNKAKVILADEQAEGTPEDIERDIALAYSEIARIKGDDEAAARAGKRIARATK